MSIARPLVIDPACRGIYQGTFPSNELLPKPTKFPAGYILNTDRSGNVGMHWYAMFVWDKSNRQRTAEVFDSLGTRGPLPQALRMSLTSWRVRNVIRTTETYQHPTLSQACGSFAIYFIRMRCHGHSLDRVLKELKPGEYLSNERIVKRYASLSCPLNGVRFFPS